MCVRGRRKNKKKKGKKKSKKRTKREEAGGEIRGVKRRGHNRKRGEGNVNDIYLSSTAILPQML